MGDCDSNGDDSQGVNMEVVQLDDVEEEECVECGSMLYFEPGDEVMWDAEREGPVCSACWDM